MTCIGCGEENPKGFLFVGVCRAGVGHLEPLATSSSGEWEAHGICNACHREPMRRKPKLKMHYFGYNQMESALEAAGSSTGVAG